MNNFNTIKPRGIILIFFWVSILLIQAACTSGSSATPEVTNTLAAPSHELIYTLSFDDNTGFSDWWVGAPGIEAQTLQNTVDGKYLFEYPSGFLENLVFDFSDVQIGVDVEFLVTSATEVSLACRMQPFASDRYYFTLTNAGHWIIRGAQEVILAEGNTDQVKPGSNHLAARCVGNTLTFLINGNEVGSVNDDSFASGSLNFSYNALDPGAGTFDNISVEYWGPDSIAQTATSQAIADAKASLASTAIAATPTSTPPGLYYANDFGFTSPGLEGWTTYEIPVNYHFAPLDENIEVVEKRLQMKGNNSESLYVIYDFLFSTSGWDMTLDMSFHETGDGGLSVVCEYSAGGWYELGIKSDGSWQIRRADTNSETDVTFTTLVDGYSTAITTEKNQMQVQCIDGNLSLSVNGQSAGEFTDSSPLHGGIFGLMYEENGNQPIYAEISEIMLRNPAGDTLKEFTYQQDSFSHALRVSAIAYGLPSDVRAILKSVAIVNENNGQLLVTLDSPGKWMAIYPNELMPNVEISVDVDTSEMSFFDTVGVICRWQDNNGGYAVWMGHGGFATTPIGIGDNGLPATVGPAEFFAEDNDGIIEGGPTHHITARCWGDLVEMFVDGQKISSHSLSSFPYEGNYKTGNQIGLYFTRPAESETPATVKIDNLVISWNMATLTP